MIALLEPRSTTPPAGPLRDVPLSDGAQALMSGARNVRDLISRLLAAGLAADAAQVLVRVLPKRYAIAWACECIRADAPLSAADRACLEDAERWLTDDRDDNRRAAGAHAHAQNYQTPAAMVAAAAAWSGGSLAPPGYQAVPPAEHLSAVGCHGAVLLQAAREPRQLQARLGEWVNRACASFGGGAAAS